MIRYQDRNLSLVCRLEGSVYINTLHHSGLATILAIGCLIWRDVFDGGQYFTVFSSETFTYSVFTFVLGFVLVFRCQLAYERFWGGRSAMEQMTNSFTDALVKSVVFGKFSKLPEENIRLWRTKMVSLFSLLHATALSNLHDYEAEMEVIEGIDKNVAERLSSDGVLDDVYTVYAWVQEELMMRVLDSGIAAPPPISTRSRMHFHEC